MVKQVYCPRFQRLVAMAESVDPNRLRLTNTDGSEGVLLGFRCRECATVIFGPATFCQSCTSDQLKAVEFEQHGTLYSYTIVRVPPAGWKGSVPYVLGQIELSEGPQVLAEVIDCLEEDLAVGLPVTLALKMVGGEDMDAEMVVYKWRLAK